MMQKPTLENYSSLVDTFLEFLTVAIHLILYERDIYPQRSFLKARKYNHPVRQNRHPAVCKFIDDAVAAVRVQLMKCVVSSVSLILISPSQIPLERYVFSTTSFPIVGPKEQYIPFLLAGRENEATPETGNTSNTTRLPSTHTHISDLHAQYTAVLSRLGTLTSELKPLPAESSFTLAIELREMPRGEPPIGWPMPFVPAEPGLQRRTMQDDEAVIWTVARSEEEVSEKGATQETSSGLWSSSGDAESEKGKEKENEKDRGKVNGEKGVAAKGGKPSVDSGGSRRRKGEYLGGTKTIPIRNVEAGPFVMEVWVEQNEKDALQQGTGYSNPSVTDE